MSTLRRHKWTAIFSLLMTVGISIVITGFYNQTGAKVYNPSAGGAPTDATYITQTANSSLSAEQDLSALSRGIGVIEEAGDITTTAAISWTFGGTGLSSVVDDTVLLGSSTSSYWLAAVPNCTDASGNHLNYTSATNLFSCGTSVGTVDISTDTAPDLGGDLQVHGRRVIFEYPSADDSYSGLSVTGVAGETLAFGDVLFYNTYDSRYWRGDGDTASTVPVTAIAVAAVSTGNVGTYLIEGYVRDNAWAWTTATTVRTLYVSETPGNPVQNSPQDTGDQIQVVGFLIDADVIYFQPDLTIVER